MALTTKYSCQLNMFRFMYNVNKSEIHIEDLLYCIPGINICNYYIFCFNLPEYVYKIYIL